MKRGPGAAMRLGAGAAAAAVLVLLGAAPAFAAITTPVTGASADDAGAAGGVTGGVVDEVTGAVDGAADAAAGAVSGAANEASDATGGATEPVTDPVQDVVDKANDVVDTTTDTVDQTGHEAQGAVDDAVGKATDAVDGVIDEVTGGGGDGPAGGPRASGRRSDGSAVRARGRVVGRNDRRAPRAAGLHARRRADTGKVARTPAHLVTKRSPARSTPAPTLGERLREAAIDAAKQFALPLALMVVVAGFVLAQHWADRKDPKLRLAPVSSDHDLLSFH